MDKATANYVAHPVNGERCADCSMYVDPQQCNLVTGSINPQGHCKEWKLAKLKVHPYPDPADYT